MAAKQKMQVGTRFPPICECLKRFTTGSWKQSARTYDARLFDSVYTKVEAQSKRSLTEEQMNTLLHTDFEKLPEDVQNVLAYFLLMFLFRGMPFIDIILPAQTRPKGTLYHLLPSQNRKENGSTHSA